MATRYGVEWVLPTWSSSCYFEHLAPQTTLPLNIDAVLTPDDLDTVAPSLLDNGHVIDLQGRFTSEQYFRHCGSLIRHHLEPRRQLIDQVEQQFASLIARGRMCAVVAPCRVDASERGTRIHQLRVFYREAISQVGTDAVFAVMSDDPQWWDTHLRGCHVVHLSRNDIVRNFVLGTLCQDLIVADSAFGWWIAWLNRRHDGRIIAPPLWRLHD